MFATAIFWMCLMAAAVFSELPPDRRKEPQTLTAFEGCEESSSMCKNMTEYYVVIVDKGAFSIALMLESNGSVKRSSSQNGLLLNGKGSLDADVDGSGEDELGIPNLIGIGNWTAEPVVTSKRPVNIYCRPGKQHLQKLLGCIGKPLTLRMRQIKITGGNGGKEITMEANAFNEGNICGEESSGLKDDNGVIVVAIIYEIYYFFNHEDVMKINATLRVYVLQQNATIQGVEAVGGDLKWDLEVTGFLCINSRNPVMTCKHFKNVVLKVLVDLGSKDTGKCDKNCKSVRKQSGGASVSFVNKAKVDAKEKTMTIEYVGNMYSLVLPFGEHILVDPIAVPSSEKATELDIQADIMAGIPDIGASRSKGYVTKVNILTTMPAIFAMVNFT